ncbi:MAG: hypothetical protein KF857_09185 [Fimbriimonadaceae bacterium]|nr:hypothetical protein [Fimbriimonadaceae bacterium]
MRRPWHDVDFSAVVACWRRFYPERYWVDEELVRRQTIDHPLFDWGASSIEVEGDRVVAFLAAKQTAASLFKGPNPDQAHINAMGFDDPVRMVDLMAWMKSTLRQRGVGRIAFGSDHGHFFPGVPEDCPRLVSFLEVEGFDFSGVAYDVERDMKDYVTPDWAVEPLARPDVRVSPCAPEDVEDLDTFLLREFPGRWRYDVMAKAAVEPHEVLLLWVGDSVEGMAYTQSWESAKPNSGCVWRHDLGDKFGGLGPIGVSQRVRGQRLGHALLGAGLTHLRDRGVERCLIDWTGLLDFYGAHGFEKARTYNYASLALA